MTAKKYHQEFMQGNTPTLQIRTNQKTKKFSVNDAELWSFWKLRGDMDPNIEFFNSADGFRFVIKCRHVFRHGNCLLGNMAPGGEYRLVPYSRIVELAKQREQENRQGRLL